jgi:hypothetical protein
MITLSQKTKNRISKIKEKISTSLSEKNKNSDEETKKTIEFLLKRL